MLCKRCLRQLEPGENKYCRICNWLLYNINRDWTEFEADEQSDWIEDDRKM